MTQPWEAGTDVSTKALSAYNLLLRTGVATKTQMVAYLNHFQTNPGSSPPRFAWDQDDGGPLDAPLSAAYIDDGVAHLVLLGFVTLTGDVVTATKLVAGSPAPIRRVKGDDFSLEYGQPRRPLPNGQTDPP